MAAPAPASRAHRTSPCACCHGRAGRHVAPCQQKGGGKIAHAAVARLAELLPLHHEEALFLALRLPEVCRVRKSTIAAVHAFRLTASLRTALTPGGRAMSAVHTFAQVRVRGLVGACASLGRLGEGELAVEWLKGGGLARG